MNIFEQECCSDVVMIIFSVIFRAVYKVTPIRLTLSEIEKEDCARFSLVITTYKE